MHGGGSTHKGWPKKKKKEKKKKRERRLRQPHAPLLLK
ncbi:unnamed protein product [Spirodela intermedia]|uniref:Uncharacterized protein n=1 Tax=Spirodela intermedia TaxID=51605 RepID=A0ABN7E9N1_SPIIN|nr:unnamed protein product [Spirodela intermedia]